MDYIYMYMYWFWGGGIFLDLGLFVKMENLEYDLVIF